MVKKVLVSLVLIFSLFGIGFNYTQAFVTAKEKERISNLVENYSNKLIKKYGEKKTEDKLRQINKKILVLKKIKTGRIKELLNVIYENIANNIMIITAGKKGGILEILLDDLEKNGIDSEYTFGNKKINVNEKITNNGTPGGKNIKITYFDEYSNKGTIFEEVLTEGRVNFNGVFHNKLIFSINELSNNIIYIYDFSSKKLIKTNFKNMYFIQEGKEGLYFINTIYEKKQNRKLYLLDLDNNFKKIYEDNISKSEYGKTSFGIEKLTRFELLSGGKIKLFLESTNSKGKWYVFSKIIDKNGKLIEKKEEKLDTNYYVIITYNYGDKVIKVYKKYTGNKYEKSFDKNGNPHKSLKYKLINNSNASGDNIFKETKIKVTSSIYGNKEKIIFEKTGPEYGDCEHDICENIVDSAGIFNNKLFFTSNVNIINGKYFNRKKYIYDFNKNKLIEKNFGYSESIEAGMKGIYYTRNNGTMGNLKNTKLILLNNDYNEKVLYEDSAGNQSSETAYVPVGTELLENFELLSAGRIKIFLRGYNSKGKGYVFSKIIEIE